MAEESLGIKAGRAALWQIAGGGWQTLVRLGASIYLARALRPSDFGLFGMALLYQELLVTALSLGFGTGLIVKKELSEDDLNTAFWLSCTVRFIVFWVIFITAPLAAYLWKEPRVEPIIRVISLVLLVQILGIVPETLANKHLQFKKINIIRALAILLESTTAIILVAFTNLTYWALVIGMMFNTLFYNITLWISSGCWLPRFNFHKSSFRYLFRFGFYTWLFGITNYLKQNIDYFLVGRLLGSYQLGLYEFAYRLPHLLFDRVSRPVGVVLFPAFSKIQDDDLKIFQTYVKSVQAVCLICFPLLFFLMALADILVPFLWGEQWNAIISPLKLLCLSAMIMCTIQPVGHVFLCKSRPNFLPLFSFLCLFFTFVLLVFFIRFFGLVGAALAMMVSSLFYYVMLYKAFSLINASILYFLKEIFPIFVIGVLVFLVSSIVKILFLQYGFWFVFFLSSLLSLSTVLLYCFFFPMPIMLDILSFLRGIIV